MADSTKCQEPGVKDLGALLDGGEGAMVILEAPETRLVVHRAVLSATSPVFAAMFLHDTLEASTGEVVIEDVEGPVLLQLVGFMYTGRAPQLPSMVIQLLAAADKYGVDALKHSCEQQLVAHLDLENMAAAAVLAVRYSCSTLKEATVNYVKIYRLQVMATQGWAEAVQSHPEDMVGFMRLLPQAPTVTSLPASGDSTDTLTGACAAPLQFPADSQPPLPDDAAISRFRCLSGEEKSRRLVQAAKEGSVQEMRALIAAGADVGARDEFEQTALHHAADSGHVEAVRCLLEAGAEVDDRDRADETPLHQAADNGHSAVVWLLLAASADPNARGFGEWTTLHLAATSGQAEAVAALLELGADRGAKDLLGFTAQDLARLHNHRQLVHMLE